jgi:hypothetical protein
MTTDNVLIHINANGDGHLYINGVLVTGDRYREIGTGEVIQMPLTIQIEGPSGTTTMPLPKTTIQPRSEKPG